MSRNHRKLNGKKGTGVEWHMNVQGNTTKKTLVERNLVEYC